MKKQTHIKWATGVLLVGLIAFVSETGFSSSTSSGNRWEYRFKQDTPAKTSSTTTKETPTTSNVYGDGNLNCRDSFVLMNTKFDSTTDMSKSRIAVKPLTNGTSIQYSCTAPLPAITSASGLPIKSGTITVKCLNGTAILESASCIAKTQAEQDAEDAAAAAAKAAAEKAAAEKAAADAAAAKAAADAAAAAAAAAATPQCTGCSASAKCTSSTYVTISKNAGYTKTTSYFACTGGGTFITTSSKAGSTSSCMAGVYQCPSSSGSSSSSSSNGRY